MCVSVPPNVNVAWVMVVSEKSICPDAFGWSANTLGTATIAKVSSALALKTPRREIVKRFIANSLEHVIATTAKRWNAAGFGIGIRRRFHLLKTKARRMLDDYTI